MMSVNNNRLKGQIEKFQNNTFVKSVLTLSLGVVISQAISLLTTPILSRIFSPSVYGDFALLFSDLRILSVIVCLGLMTAIMVPKSDEESQGICRIISYAVIAISTLFLIIAIAISPFYQFFNVSLDYRVACVLLWVYVVLSNLSNVLYSYVNRLKLYKILLWNPAIGTSSKAIISIGLGLVSPSLLFFMIGAIISVLLVILHMLRYANPWKGVLPQQYRGFPLLISYKQFPLYQLPANIISMVSQQLPVQFIKMYFGSAILGSYSMCLTILGIPTNFLAAPINRVYFQEASSRFNAGLDIGEFSYKIIEKNIKIAIIPIIILTIFGEWIFLVLGSEWRMAGSFASILGLYQLVLFLAFCLAGNYVIIGKQKINLIFSCIRIVINVLVFVLGNRIFGNIYPVLILLALTGSLYTLVEVGLFLYLTGVPVKKYLKFILLYIGIPILFSIIVRMLFPHSW